MMGNWQDMAHSVLLALVFAFIIAKVISLVVSHRDGAHLGVEEDRTPPPPPPPPPPPQEDEFHATVVEEQHPVPSEVEPSDNHGDVAEEEREEMIISRGVEEESKIGQEAERGESLLSDDDDWEGVESTELDEMFGAAASYVASMGAGLSQKLPSEAQAQLYGLYKVATEGPCTAPQPSPLKTTARAKWHAWQRLGNMNPEVAMEQYISLLTEIFPSWIESLDKKHRKQELDSFQQSTSSEGMTSVVSSLMHQEVSDDDVKLETIHVYAREGDIAGLLQVLEQGVPVDLRDSRNRTALHWAVDRGHLEVAKVLISKGSDVNAKDVEGQTALHYAAVCEWEDIAKHLINHGADISLKDNDGVTPYNLRPADWYWMSDDA